jgi:hypothetical protein
MGWDGSAHQLQPEDGVDEAVGRVREEAQVDADAPRAPVRRAERLVRGRQPPQRRRQRRALAAGVDDDLQVARRPRTSRMPRDGDGSSLAAGEGVCGGVGGTCQSWPARRNGAERTASPGPAASRAAWSSSTVIDSVMGSASL